MSFDDASDNPIDWSPEKRTKWRAAPMKMATFEDAIMPLFRTLKEHVLSQNERIKALEAQVESKGQKPRVRIPAKLGAPL